MEEHSRAQGSAVRDTPAAAALAVTRSHAPARVVGLRVVIFSDALRDRNGVDAYYRDLVQHLSTRVERVELINPDSIPSNYIKSLSMPLPGDPTQSLCCPNPRRLYRRVREIDPDVIVMATPGPFGLCALLTAKLLGVRLIAGFHTHLERLADLYWSRFVGGLGSRTLEMCNRLVFRYARPVVVNSRHMATTAQRLGVRSPELVGTPIGPFFLSKPVVPLAAELRSVLYAGRLSPEKNVDVVLEAAERSPAIRFSIAGEGPLAGLVRARSRELDNLRYLGPLPRDRLVEIIDEADLLVLPSKVEAFGTIAVEAMARGRLVLVSRHCGILRWPMLAKGIFDVQDDERLADAIERIARIDPALRAHKANKARAAARAFHEQTVEQWLGIVSRVGAQR